MDVLDFWRDLNFHQGLLWLLLAMLHESVVDTRKLKGLGSKKSLPHGTLTMKAKKSFEFCP